MHGETRAHYDRLADSYNENWAHSGEFIGWMTECILKRLDPAPGVGRFSKRRPNCGRGPIGCPLSPR
ncbi:hypothetical protein [Actinoallomurus sp. NPDC050550]|uniref:hypothetical protein n=1 Tax=Actinoallomurus sp. NPDC050550 TaxID=3154937 RepID=UPI003401C9C0